ncbi:MAG: SigE family RNA polymerase sigma factor [Actinomycetota bacterium]|nr:SigE family RNA polymerase sigma factor [Actinomycetota bacterium]
MDVGSDAAAGIVTEERTGRLESLYRQHAARATRVAYLLVGDAGLAQELAHDAFIRTSGKIHTLRDPNAFGAYLTRTTINLCKRHHQRKSLERRHVDLAGPTIPAHVPPPDVGTKDEVMRVVRALPHRQRAAIVLRFYADLSESDIADTLGCPVGTVKSLISRGLAKLRTQLGGER